MAVSLSELIIISLLIDWILRKVHIPGLVGMLCLGILFGPFALDLISPDLLNISYDLRAVALIVILLRAGLELSRDTLARVGKQVLLLSAVPALFEGASVTVAAHFFLGLTYLEGAVLGSVLGAVSPAVVVPLMIEFIEKRKGAEKGIPTLILAASSIDDVFVIVIYSILIGSCVGDQINVIRELASIPLSILIGTGTGLVCGAVLYRLFEHYNPRATKRALIILGISILLMRIEHLTKDYLPFASLLAVMAIGFVILEKREHMAHELSAKFSKIWVFAEILLFTMVGAQVNIKVGLSIGVSGALVILTGLAARGIGTYLSLAGSTLNGKEKLFVVISYIPKATVQAAIGAAPLAAMKLAGMNTEPGEIILAVAVLSILLTAPLGAWAIAYSGNRILKTAAPAFDDSRQAALESDPHGEDIV